MLPAPKTARVLRIGVGDDEFAISLEPQTLGHVVACRHNRQTHRFGLPHPQWRIIGVSFHHWRKGVDLPFTPDMDPETARNGIVWDFDHGTLRRWGGLWHGKPRRVRWAVIEQALISTRCPQCGADKLLDYGHRWRCGQCHTVWRK